MELNAVCLCPSQHLSFALETHLVVPRDEVVAQRNGHVREEEELLILMMGQ
jgi:hypothetical protein